MRSDQTRRRMAETRLADAAAAREDDLDLQAEIALVDRWGSIPREDAERLEQELYEDLSHEED